MVVRKAFKLPKYVIAFVAFAGFMFLALIASILNRIQDLRQRGHEENGVKRDAGSKDSSPLASRPDKIYPTEPHPHEKRLAQLGFDEVTRCLGEWYPGDPDFTALPTVFGGVE